MLMLITKQSLFNPKPTTTLHNSSLSNLHHHILHTSQCSSTPSSLSLSPALLRPYRLMLSGARLQSAQEPTATRSAAPPTFFSCWMSTASNVSPDLNPLYTKGKHTTNSSNFSPIGTNQRFQLQVYLCCGWSAGQMLRLANCEYFPSKAR